MHEIVYLQLGNLPNYIGTHFWNAQDAYGEDEVNPEVSWSIRERIEGMRKVVVYRPRLLIFDFRKNLGGLQNYSVDWEPGTIDGSSTPNTEETWGERVQTLEAPLIPPSRYLEQLHNQDESQAKVGDENQLSETPRPNPREVRYWSDFSHVHFAPESIQALSSSVEYNANGLVAWHEGRSDFERYDAEMDVMDGPVRQLVEECDSLQGFQGIDHSPTMAGFSSCLSERIVDEFPKVPKIQFTLLDGYKAILGATSVAHSPQRILSNILCLHSLSRLHDTAVPLNPYEMWPDCPLRDRLSLFETYSEYNISAVYAAHIETITWGTRRRGAERHAEYMVNRMNVDGRMPFACLGGIVPMIDQDDPFKPSSVLDLTLPEHQGRANDTLTRYNVLRGAVGDLRSSNRPSIELIDSNPYPLPLSHPQIFTGDKDPAQLNSVPIYSTLEVRKSFGRVLAAHTTWCDEYIRRKGDIGSTGLELDEMKVVLEELRAVEEVYGD
ncbi:related to MtDNA inheritance protein Dml1-Laccaria bicolor [Serendipita indica DSM 11827]|uniref:Related to MtDNA inheritance protein Dml1-Laccaria bicolor n=1 Tax=Serendipita indica (strain DSM 11827) TaxID=1109443 RepID=G4T572_SERID|nr:related to MtDNA inheritance protein Dml1-Laccaria bicolor [Serendipita indica DSM 11827]